MGANAEKTTYAQDIARVEDIVAKISNGCDVDDMLGNWIPSSKSVVDCVGLSFAARSAKGDVIVIDSPVYRGFFGGMSLGPC